MSKFTTSFIAFFITILSLAAGSVYAQDNVILEHRMVTKNGELPRATEADLQVFASMLNELRTHGFYRLVIRGAFSDMRWRGVPPEHNNALDGGISTERAGRVLDFFTDAGMTEAEKSVLHILYLPDNSETQASEPYVQISVVEDTEYVKLKEEFELWKEEANGQIIAISEQLKALTERVKSLSQPLLLSYDTSPKNPGLGKLSDHARRKIQDMVDAANPNEHSRVLVTAESPEAFDATKKLLMDDFGLKKEPFESKLETQSGVAQEAVLLTLLDSDTGTWTKTPHSKRPKASQKFVNVMVGVTVNTAGGWDDHLTPGVDETKFLPTLDLRLGLGSTTFTCKAQLPGELFENAGGKLKISEIQMAAKLVGPLCLTASWEGYVTRKPYQTPLAPGQDLVFKEKTSGFGVGTQFNGNLTRGTGLLRSLSFGVDLLFLDRKYEIPAGGNSTVKFKSDGDTQVRGYLSYHLPLLSF